MSNAMPVAEKPRGTSFLYHQRQLQQNTIPYLESLAAQGDFLRLPIGPVSAYYVNHPDHVREVLVTQARAFHKPGNVKYAVRGMIGTNLFAADSEVWRVLRKSMSPAFHTQRIHNYATMMADLTNEMLSGWDDGATVDVPAQMMDLTLGVTTRALFDVDLRDKEAGEAVLTFLELFNERITGFPVPGWLPTPANRKMKDAIAVGDRLLLPLIAERQRSGADHGDLLSMLLVAQREDDSGVLTDHQVRNEILNLFAAGYEVTGHTLAFTLYLIATHPEVESRLLVELDSEVGERRVTVDDLPNLPYMEQVLKESMRLLPVTTMLGRQTAQAVTVGGYDLPKNSVVLVAPWTLHRRPDAFPDPDRFDPDRFSPAREDSIPKHAYIPFSTGPRVCLGNAFAMLQMRVNLATILQRYTLATAPGYQFEPVFRFNTRPKNGLPMVATARERVTA